MNTLDPHTVDAVVIGGGMAGLVAAWQLTQEGLRPVLVESRGYTGGLVAGSTLAGISYDIGAEGWAIRLPDTAELAEELGVTVEKPRTAPSWVYFDDACFAMPGNAILGIPADLSDPAVVIALGAKEAARAAALDRAPMPDELPRDLGTLVESRMGPKVLRRLVTPIAGGIHAADPHLLSADVVSPGLRAAAQSTGSLAAGVALCRSRMPEGPVVASVAGGMFTMPAELRRQAEEAGARIMTRVGARKLTCHGDQWLVETADTSRNPNPSLPPVPDGEVRTFLTPRVVVPCSLFCRSCHRPAEQCHRRLRTRDDSRCAHWPRQSGPAGSGAGRQPAWKRHAGGSRDDERQGEGPDTHVCQVAEPGAVLPRRTAPATGLLRAIRGDGCRAQRRAGAGGCLDPARCGIVVQSGGGLPDHPLDGVSGPDDSGDQGVA